ncbi:uncharacterized protein LTR77_003236 [Saxophila tyrrhenica]|uniref:Uncharacterized protein n=1 Tax=Saxophila tyrrhenica TaxID=1690608 RepID=A0AAV9PGU2_9PEZI|nr:hypothetical protein LTR77_003236 [Saxophila tyrrhenica]
MPNLTHTQVQEMIRITNSRHDVDEIDGGLRDLGSHRFEDRSLAAQVDMFIEWNPRFNGYAETLSDGVNALNNASQVLTWPEHRRLLSQFRTELQAARIELYWRRNMLNNWYRALNEEERDMVKIRYNAVNSGRRW